MERQSAGQRLTPFSYQQEILDKLEVERTVRRHYRNLIVAATGTGKQSPAHTMKYDKKVKQWSIIADFLDQDRVVHEDELMADWELAISGNQVFEISPLK